MEKNNCRALTIKALLRKPVGFLFLWLCISETKAQEPRLVLPVGHSSLVECAAFSPDGNYVVTASSDKTIKIWEALTGRLLDELKGHTNDVNSLSFSADGKQLLSSSADGSAKVWNWRERKLIKSFGGGTSLRYGAFAPDGKSAMTISYG
ncbi:MAG: hypothetical protein EON98_07030, partial [Chitinophagaceae bacterium]